MKQIWINMRKILIRSIEIYQKYISPMKNTKCPYIPSCSEYGKEAIIKYGVIVGSLMAIWRICRCNPFSQGGYDPVPKEFRKNRRKE